MIFGVEVVCGLPEIEKRLRIVKEIFVNLGEKWKPRGTACSATVATAKQIAELFQGDI